VESGKLNGVTSKTVLSDADKLAIASDYTAGAGVVELARKYRCRTAQINQIIRAPGVPLRKTLTANTPIETRLHDALMAAGIGFSTQKRLVGRYVVDISVHQAPVVIEADGARHRAGAAAQERDAVRDAAHRAAGYSVFRFTGSEINTDAVACIRQVIDACGLVPDSEPVYDIRTKFSGTDHPRYVGEHDLTCKGCGNPFRARKKRKYCTHECYIADAIRGKPKSAQQRAKIGDANRERVWTDEARAKLSAAREGMPSPNRGRPMSADQRAKISATLLGHKQSDETREKKRAAHLGLKHSEETRAKISAGMRSRQTVIEPELRGDAQRPAETTGPATLF
jgi:very-short-patch-repair endonuclease